MELRAALTEQYLGGLAMLRQCVERCPDPIWTGGEYPRTYWRIAYHAVFYTHLYLVQSEAVFQPWAKHREGATALWEDDEGPAPETMGPYGREDVCGYIDEVASMVPEIVAGLDLSSNETGFDWYPEMTKLSHQLMNLRHLQGHVGQLSERLMANGVDIDWISRATSPRPAIARP